MPKRRQPTVVVVTDRILFPAREGSLVRIVALVRALKQAGFRVVLIARRAAWRRFPRMPGPRSTLASWRLADAFVSVDAPAFTSGSPMAFDFRPYADALDRAITRHRPVAVIAEYLWLAPCLDVVPEGILRVVDTHDVMHVRSAMYADQPEGAWVVCTEREETALLGHADVIVAIQERELGTFTRMLPAKRIVCIPHIVANSLPLARTPHELVVAFVGSRIQGNVAGLRAFVDEAWPVVRNGCPNAKLYVYGDVVSRLERDAPGMRRIGLVRDVSRVYRTAAVIINPVTLGTGLKIKTVEALAHASALVTTRCGAAGLERGASHAFLMEDHMPSFGKAVADLLRDEGRRQAMGRAAHAFAMERFSAAAVGGQLRALLAPGDGLYPRPSDGISDAPMSPALRSRP